MDVEDNGDFRRRLVMLAEVFDLKLAATRQALYFEALRDLPLEAVMDALNLAVKTCRFFPKPAELRTLAVGDSEDRAEAGWLAFKAATRSAGAYASLAVTDPVLAETIVAMFGSWPNACSADLSPEMWSSKRKEWGRVYRAMSSRQLVGPRYLPGICEQQNAGRLDWMAHVPMKRLGAGGVETLSLAQAEEARTAIAAQAYGFKQLGELDQPALGSGEDSVSA